MNHIEVLVRTMIGDIWSVKCVYFLCFSFKISLVLIEGKLIFLFLFLNNRFRLWFFNISICGLIRFHCVCTNKRGFLSFFRRVDNIPSFLLLDKVGNEVVFLFISEIEVGRRIIGDILSVVAAVERILLSLFHFGGLRGKVIRTFLF